MSVKQSHPARTLPRQPVKIVIIVFRIAGITGNLSKHLFQSALNRVHRVPGLGRSPSRIQTNIKANLDGFITIKTWYDIPAIEEAVKNVNAVVCAYSGRPELQLDAQLILLRATERAGIRVCFLFDFTGPSVRVCWLA